MKQGTLAHQWDESRADERSSAGLKHEQMRDSGQDLPPDLGFKRSFSRLDHAFPVMQRLLDRLQRILPSSQFMLLLH